MFDILKVVSKRVQTLPNLYIPNPPPTRQEKTTIAAIIYLYLGMANFATKNIPSNHRTNR